MTPELRLITTSNGLQSDLPTQLVNMCVEATPNGPRDYMVVGRPGLVQSQLIGDGPVRASFLWQGGRFTVSGSDVYRNNAKIGSINPLGNVRYALSDEELVIVSGGAAYYVTTISVAQIVDPDLPLYVSDVIFSAGRFVYSSGNSAQFYWSDLGDAQSIDGLSFATADENTDDIVVAMAVIIDQIVFFTRKTVEWWVPNDDPDAPYIRSSGRKNDKGLLAQASVVLLDNALFFVGTDLIVYRLGAVPQAISMPSLSKRIAALTAPAQANLFALSVVLNGHPYYVLTSPGNWTWAYDVSQKSWIEWRSQGQSNFRAASFDGFLAGDGFSGALMAFIEGVFTDLDGPLERVIPAYLPLAAGSIRCNNLILNCSRGVGLPSGYGVDPVVEMRFSDHEGADWSIWQETPIGELGNKATMAIWTALGAISAPGRLFEFRCTDPVEFNAFYATFNLPRLT